MSEPPARAGQLQTWIDRIQVGDQAARAELLGHACEQLRVLTRKMLREFARVRRWEETDDVLQNALLRLWHALEVVTPRSVREFCGLASLQIRRELIDLARQHYGPHGLGANQAGPLDAGDSTHGPRTGVDRADSTHDPGGLAVWSEFHRRVDALPEEEREVFDLLWYQEVAQAEAASLLGISEATLRRRWLSARRRLYEALHGSLPGE
jgi:RNA polymerase sigma-70 factor (ECF subfamily)